MAATQEFYIRNETETEARGPFTVEQLVSLAEAGQVTDETLCYDAVTEQWAPISTNETLKASVFPVRKKLVVRKDLTVTTLNTANKDNAPITVDDMLAAAEGKTADTKGRSDPTISMARAAKVGMWACVATLAISAAGGLLPQAEAIQAMDLRKLLAPPFAILGLLDLLLAVLLGMGVVTIYPFVRFRAALGFGFIGFLFYTQGLEIPLLSVAVGCAGLYLCTVFTNLLLVLVTATAAIVGMAGVAYHLLSLSV